jgi:hypothetical protein
MRRHRLRFGGGNTGSLNEGGEVGVDATVGDTSLEGVLLNSDSEPEPVTGGASEGDLVGNGGARVIGGDSALCVATSGACSCPVPGLSLGPLPSCDKASPPVCTSSFSSRSSMLLRPSRLVRCER